MGIREKINRNPVTAGAIAMACILAGVLISVLYVQSTNLPESLTQAYYSTDDGQSYFADDAGLIYPFEKGGKTAYRAYVYQWSGASKPSVVYLERFTDQGRSKLSELRQKPAGTVDEQIAKLYSEATEVKRPGETEWVPATDHDRWSVITTPSRGEAQGIYPTAQRQ